MKRLSCLFSLLFGLLVPAAERLPLPERGVPEAPPYPASVVTAGGQRRLLEDVAVTVRCDPATRQVTVTPSGWWVVNFPLDRIAGLEGLDEDQVCQLLFQKPRAALRNWYFRTPGEGTPEPPPASGPAPIRPSALYHHLVAGDHPAANDDNPGTAEKPLKTIGAALRRAQPGEVVRIEPGVYRETLDFPVAGRADAPIRVEGVRDGQGRMPVVDGNDPFPPQSWQPVPGWPGVHRAALFTNLPGPVCADDVALAEASWPGQLEPGQFCLNRASREFLHGREEAAEPVEGLAEQGAVWRKIAADGEGMLTLGEAGEPARYRLSAWVWVAPKARAEGVVWDPRFPEPVSGRVECKGPFRAFRQTGTSVGGQVNKYRMWVNGTALPSAWVPGQPRAHHNYGKTDTWHDFSLREGWNHLLFEFDTCTKPGEPRIFRFGVPQGIKSYLCSAAPPADRAAPGEGAPTDHVAEALLLGPLPATPDGGVYVRLPGDADPNTVPMSLAARTLLAKLEQPFVQVAGLEFRHGAYFQQRAQMNVAAPGCLVEGCRFRDSEVRGITAALGGMDQTDPPIVLRNNWILNPGGVGIGASGSSEKLTPENQDREAPGRGRLLCEYNLVANNNRNGYPRFWESGGFKMFRLTGAVLRQNTFLGGDGPGLWLDWEHYGNRIEGNVSVDGTAFLVGVEASPGPNLVASNLCVNLKTGGVWFRHGILAWSSHAVWAVHNTIDGRWNETPAWQNKTGAGGIYLHEGGADRRTRWVPVPKQQAILNNLIVGVDADDVIRRWGWNENTPELGNHHDTRDQPWTVFRAPETLDYRLRPDAPPLAGAEHALVGLVRHDFHGLLRHPDLPPVAGAFRVDPPGAAATLVEAEFTDGTMRRYY